MASTASSSNRRMSIDKENMSMNKIAKGKTGLGGGSKVAKSITSSHHNIGSKLTATKEAVKKVIQSQQRLSINTKLGMPIMELGISPRDGSGNGQARSLSPRPYDEESEEYESEDGNITYSIIESSVYDE